MQDRSCATCKYWRERLLTSSPRLGKIGECVAAPPVELAGERTFPLTSERSNCESWEPAPISPRKVAAAARSRAAVRPRVAGKSSNGEAL